MAAQPGVDAVGHRVTRSTCPYCGVGCGVLIESDGRQVTGVRGDPAHPANAGRLCSKGATLHLSADPVLGAQTRLLQPMQRLQRGAPAQVVSWDHAMAHAAARLTQVITEHGPNAVGFYVSGQLLTEDYYVFNKLVKGLIGSNNLDTNSRLCMSSAAAAYKLTLGADSPPSCYDDVNHAQCLFIVGSNTAWAHPVLFRRIEDAKAANPALKIIVADPRRTATADMADLFLPLQPGTDVMLFHGMLHIMLWEGWVDADFIAAHTSGFDALKALVRDCTPDRVARICGLPQADVLQAARWFAGVAQGGGRQPTLSLYCQGLNQSSSGTAKNAALINLHLACGQIGQAGSGPFSLTGQPNAMGGREVGGMANLLSAHRDLANPAHRAQVAALWGVDAVPDQPGLTAVEMFQAAAEGRVKALWIACTNPAQSMPDQALMRRALQRADLVVVQEAFATSSTCAYADLLLPASTWAEKDGTVTNSERRISRVRAAVAAPAGARHDWQIVCDLGQRLQPSLRPAHPGLLDYTTPESIWNEHRESTRGRDLDITGLTYTILEDIGPQQWPSPTGAPMGQARLYADGRFATHDGLARFVAQPYQPVAQMREARFPFSLLTGRLRDQWHGMTRTGQLGHLYGHAPEPVLQMHPQDMQRRGLAAGELVQVTSLRGSIVVPLEASTDLGLSQVFMAMHWGGDCLSGRGHDGTPLAGVNALTDSTFCPSSKQPELKHAAVKVLKAELPWTLLAMAWLPQAEVLRVRAQLQALMAQFSFAICVPFGSPQSADDASSPARTGLLFRAAEYQAPPEPWVQAIEALLGLDGVDVLRYQDRRQGQRRSVRLQRDAQDTRLTAFLLSGDTRAAAWIKTLLLDQLPAQTLGRLVLAPGVTPPTPIAARSPVVCNCAQVSASAILAHLAQATGTSAQRMDSLLARLKCGTVCGSCLPELRRMERAA